MCGGAVAAYLAAQARLVAQLSVVWGAVQVVHSSLRELQRALKGEVLLSSDLEAVGNAMFDGRVPALWMGQSYPSMKPLGSYVEDLLERIRMMQVGGAGQ
jgi:dynein heavy chain, axonemal